MTIGYQAVALVTPVNAPVFPLHATDLFSAVASHADRRAPPAVWRDVDANLPVLPIGLLAPPAGSVASRLFDTYVMEPACSRVCGARAPFELAARMDFCSSLRAHPNIGVRNSASDELAEWARSAPAGGLAVVSPAELRQLDRSVVVLPLDDALPTAENIESGRYPAAEKIALLIVLPHGFPLGDRDAMRRATFELLSERSIGPEGSLAHAGLIPLPPAERVAARSRAIAFVENP